MATRINYEKYEDPKGKYDLISYSNFYSDKYTKHEDGEEEREAMYIVYLDTENIEYLIKNTNSRRLYKGGENINNLQVLKRAVKTHLEKLGVKFNKEVRDNTSRVKGKNCAYPDGRGGKVECEDE